MNHRTGSIALLSLLLVVAVPVVAQPSPSPTVSPSPVLTTPQQEAVEKIVDERFEKSSKVSDRIQSTVNNNFGWSINLLTALIAVLGISPIIIGVFVWLLRGSVIQQMVIETRKQLSEEIEKEVKEQLKVQVAEELQNQVNIFRQDLESLKAEFVSQLQTLFIAAQNEKDNIFQELARITPSVIQEEFVTPEVQQKIQELTRQLELLQAANTQLSLTADDYIKQGDAFYFEDRYEEAAIAYDNAVKINPNLLAAWIAKGKALRRIKRYQEALIANEQAIKIDANNYWSWFGRGYTLTDLQRYEEALTAFERSTAINPKIHYGWKHCGYVLTKMGRYNDAIASYEKALELQPNSSGTHYWRAYYYATQRQIDQAIDDLKQAFALNPKHRETARTDPDFGTIRSDQRFKLLVEPIS